MKKVLIVAYHFPPLGESSGRLRALKFCRYLPEAGWLPIVLTVNSRAYERTDSTQLQEVPPEVEVLRTFALDTRRHLAIRQRYLRWMSLPDRWVSWCMSGAPAGLFTVYRRHVDVILTTFPIATAVLIGLILHRVTGRPWVVDLRDSMTEDEYPPDPQTRRIYRWIERQTVRYASLLLFTAASTLEMYLKRYPDLQRERCLLLPNGYDEEDFQGLALPKPMAKSHRRPIRLLHIGLIYPQERDPRPFFQGLARLKSEGRIDAADLQIDLRGSGQENLYADLICKLGIEDIVHLLPPVSYRQALEQGTVADGLILFQGASCNHQIPAKVYEYFRLRKPILALTSQTGDTAALLRKVGGASIVDIADAEAIYGALPVFLRSVQGGTHPLPDKETTGSYARRNQVQELSRYLTALCDGRQA